jgi:DNA-binding XRE family transcriptional regulator
MSKAELSQKTGLSIATIDRIEKGGKCHLATKKKIILGLGAKVAEGYKLFDNED